MKEQSWKVNVKHYLIGRENFVREQMTQQLENEALLISE